MENADVFPEKAWNYVTSATAEFSKGLVLGTERMYAAFLLF
jgi:hypothetical protein